MRGHAIWVKFISNSIFHSLSCAARLALHCNASYNHSEPFIKCHDCPQALVSKLADSNSQPRLISGQIPSHQSPPLMYYPCSKCPCLSIIWAVIIYELGFYGAWTAPPASRCESCHLDGAEEPLMRYHLWLALPFNSGDIFSWHSQCNSDPWNALRRIAS